MPVFFWGALSAEWKEGIPSSFVELGPRTDEANQKKQHIEQKTTETPSPSEIPGQDAWSSWCQLTANDTSTPVTYLHGSVPLIPFLLFWVCSSKPLQLPFLHHNAQYYVCLISFVKHLAPSYPQEHTECAWIRSQCLERRKGSCSESL